MIREDSFLKKIPEDLQEDFVEREGVLPSKVALLKTMIANRFPVS